MSSIGETLRRERQRRNLDLDQISHELKISSRFLEAIEDERFDKLPAGVFAKSFVRQYATLLGLDAEELVAEVQRTLTPAPPPGAPGSESSHPSLGSVPDLHIPRVEQCEAVGDRRHWSSSLPSFALVVVVMLVCSGLYAFWQRSRRPVTAHETAAPVEVSRPPAQQAPAVVPSPAPQTPATPAQGAGELASAAPPAASPSSPAAPPANNAQPQPTPQAQPPAGAEAGTANRIDNSAAPPSNPTGPVHVEITAAEPVWVLARANGKYLFSGTLDTNQTRSVDTNGTLLLRVGNAGGLNITLNGKPIGAVGPKGQIRDVQFTSGGFHIVAAPKPPSPPADPL